MTHDQLVQNVLAAARRVCREDRPNLEPLGNTPAILDALDGLHEAVEAWETSVHSASDDLTPEGQKRKEYVDTVATDLRAHGVKPLGSSDDASDACVCGRLHCPMCGYELPENYVLAADKSSDDFDWCEWDEIREAMQELWHAHQAVAGGLHGFEDLDPAYRVKRAGWCEEQSRHAIERYRALVEKQWVTSSPKASEAQS